MKMKSRFPIAMLMLSASPYILAEEVKPADAAPQAQAAAASDAPASDDVQKVVIVSTGSRGAQRTLVDTPVPIDILSSRELSNTAQTSLDKALGFRVPSFNTVQTPVNDATSLLDPYEIRNMGPSRVLVLINGKRKNQSSLVYVQTSPGRGESGADISAIPQDAIKRIEVLRDGASAQYGSDAIAGVVNIILKDAAEGGSVTARAGETHKNDGKTISTSLNQGLALGDSGFINYTAEVSHVGLANRPTALNPLAENYELGGTLDQVKAFLAKYPDARNINGSPQTNTAKAEVNARYNLSDEVNIYGNAAYVRKKVDSYANYRTPYWRDTDYGLLHAAGQPYDGYGPQFTGTLDDFNATGGIKFVVGGWNADLSLTYGGNKQQYDVGDTVNRAWQEDYLAHANGITTPSPTNFDAGGVKFQHWVVNADVNRQVADNVSAYAGTELRHEQYDIIAGELASYYKSGADSYAGNSAANSGTFSRSNYGVYGGATWDVSKDLLFDATGRYEKYTDFGSAVVGKLSSRFKVNDQVTLRGSLSSGFRAPSLAQIYTQKDQYSFSGGTIKITRIVNNVSPEAQALGVPKLKAEKSDSLTLGLGIKPDSDTSLTVDYYNIKVKNRIVLSDPLGPSGDASQPLDKQLAAGGLAALSFFVNGMDTRTEGFDYVASRKNIPVADGKLTLNLSGNITTKNERIGNVFQPAGLPASTNVIGATDEALMFSSRPKYKTILGMELDYNKVNFSLNNTVFGPTRFRNADLADLNPDNLNNLEVEFKTKVVTDFGMNYNLSKDMTLSFNINNLLNVTPEWRFKALNAKGQAVIDDKTILASSGMTPIQTITADITFAGRYSMMTYDGSHFSQLGRTFAASLNYRF